MEGVTAVNTTTMEEKHSSKGDDTSKSMNQ